MPEKLSLHKTSPAFRLMLATSWLAPDVWRDRQESAIREAVSCAPNWDEYLNLVDRHRTPALSWATLKRVQGLYVPEHAKLELQRRSDACRMKALRHAQLLAEILKVFNRAEIPVMSLKGPLLSLQLYGDVGLRHSIDLDLAVVRQDIKRSRACLEGLGWTLDPNSFLPATPRQWEAYWQNESQLVFFHSAGNCELELQWRNYREDDGQTEDRWAHSIASVWQGYSYRAMDAVYQVLYLCSHGGEHAWFRAKWLGDLARIYASQTVSWEEVLQEARNSNQERELLTGLRLLNEVYELPLPELAGNPWEDPPEFLIKEQLRCLKVIEEFDARSPLVQLRDQVWKFHHDRLLRPHRTWRQNLAAVTYRSPDFKEVPLPDSLFWAYGPLRPILWARRRMRQERTRARDWL